jgi:predicted dehydrogenase
MQKLRVGIVGCGEVTQTIHLPTLLRLRDHFEVTALCDISGKVRAGVGAQVPWASQHADGESLLQQSHVDAVLVANPHALHAETALCALAAGKHVLVEKPLCTSIEEADRLEAAARASGAVVQVGYMRRYAASFLEATAMIIPLRERVRLARFHDVVGRNSAIVDSTSNVIRDTAVPEAARAHAESIELAGLHSLRGSTDAPFPNVFSMLLGLGSHDLSAMRELLGMPRAVLYAAQRSEGRYLAAAFDYGHFVTEFTAAVDELPRYDTYFEVFTDDRVIRVDYDTPYVLNLPARLSVTSFNDPAGVMTQSSFPTRQDAFESEWLAFHGSVSTGQQPKTGIDDARHDLLLIRDMMAAMA